MRRPALALAALLLSAPSTLLAQADAEQVSRRHQEILPAVGEERSATVGEPIYEEIDQTEYLWAELTSDALAGSNVILKKGATLWAIAPRTFCSWTIPGRFCWEDLDGNGTFEKVKAVAASTRYPSASGRYKESWKPGDEPGSGRRWELVYLGAGGGVLRLAAREFSGSSSTPATSSDVTFDLAPSGPTQIAVRGAKLEVLEAGNSGIRIRRLP